MSKFALSHLSNYLVNQGFNQTSRWGSNGKFYCRFTARVLDGEVCSSIQKCMDMFEHFEGVINGETTDGYVISVSTHKREVICQEPDTLTLTTQDVQYTDYSITFELQSDCNVDLPIGKALDNELKFPPTWTTSACMTKMMLLRDYLLD